ncbi:uncharacterized protein MELLADRAFT_94433 [Melampsora larici-populina 98AG31]|uniref:RING-type domain-containing protein n=1 Tax=Melampsora larici-populina (strain 98AG31 / pathotype 3-4-7) TaxID=747676 RepID=F4RBI1_MELLP|nr:uncharacterized protein MELLADRAFT_94433 [Melampsora larici-populina 98AG31]EGG10091.1 hypothetical protein MELLADRAFT_94433 [Melampsora larici-populina 98AG31]
MSESILTIDECFSSPQRPEIKSERLRVRVKTQGESLNIGQLKKAIIKKGYPSLSDPSRITLIIPDGRGTLLHDHMMASMVPLNSNILALVSPSANETTRLHSKNGINLPSILFVYTNASLKTFIKMPESIPLSPSGVWLALNLTWNVTLEQLISYFIGIGFNQDLVVKESHRHDAFLSFSSSGPFSNVNPNHKGYLAPQLMFRLWDAAGLNKLIASQNRDRTRCTSEIEVYSASCFSVDSVSSTSTIHGGPHGYSPKTPTPIPSVIMASPSEHESAYDEGFYQHFNQSARTVTSASSESGRSASSGAYSSYSSSSSSGVDDYSDRESMDWRSSTTTRFSSSNRISNLVKKIQELTQERDRVLGECEKLKENQPCSSKNSHQSRKLEEERTILTNQLKHLNQENCTLKEEIQAEVQTVEALFQRIGDLEAMNHSTQAEVKAEVQSIRENLSGVITCPICCERYGSLSSNADRRPIHLSCGHIFCATCLDTDWRSRFNDGNPNPYRCFNRCTNVDPSRLGEIYLLEEVKEILDRLTAC